ncbi:hypothetical protein TNCV_73691 [Trichonephila clavipes]|nr:hypothetical protein TNCV_73691 [Trichonephila clavipes]
MRLSQSSVQVVPQLKGSCIIPFAMAQPPLFDFHTASSFAQCQHLPLSCIVKGSRSNGLRADSPRCYKHRSTKAECGGGRSNWTFLHRQFLASQDAKFYQRFLQIERMLRLRKLSNYVETMCKAYDDFVFISNRLRIGVLPLQT